MLLDQIPTPQAAGERTPSFDDGMLRCGQCGRCEGLHHDVVEAFERGEDAKDGLHVRIVGGQMHVDRKLAGNPSERRHGLAIEFWCELCGGRSRLTIAQHKGAELVRMVALPPPITTP
jgi:hypothetical protein